MRRTFVARLTSTLTFLVLGALWLAACGRQPDNEREIAVAVALTQTAAAPTATAPPATPTLPSPPTATLAPPTATSSATPPPAASEELAAELAQRSMLSLGIEPGAEGIEAVSVLPLQGDPQGRTLWLAHTVGLRRADLEQDHLLVIYSHDARGWREVASVDLRSSNPQEPGPDYLGEGAVQQVQVEPTNLWIQVEAGVGAHSGLYALYRFDGQGFKREALGSNAHPAVGQLDDLNGDGVPEVVLDVSDYYVFCYSCGVRYAQFNILRWDGVRMAPVTLNPLADSAPEALREANQAALRLAAAGLWGEAVAAIDAGSALNADDPLFEWNAVYIQYNAQAKLDVINDRGNPGYPLLAHLFYGDYAGVLDVMRAFPSAEIFALRTPLIAGTPAEGATQQLANRILSSVEPALRVRPELAAAYFLRAWGTFLKNGFADDAVLADLAQAAQLDGDEPLFAQTVAFFGGEPGQLTSATQSGATAAVAPTAAITVAAVVTVTTPAADTAQSGRIYFSAPDVEGRMAVFVIGAAPGAQPARIVPDAVQPAVQPGGSRIAFHSTRDDMLGLGGFDLTTGERLRFAYNVEDALPTWNPTGEQLFFASTRYGDGRWRLYHLWADGSGEATDLREGQDPAWSPLGEEIVYRGCDEAGGHCGLWLMRSDGSQRRPLTDNPGDARPRWLPDGASVVFMSDQRDDNWELYTVDVATGDVTRLTNHAANDGLPAVSPDGRSVAFLSDRSGDWAIWIAPLAGGAAQQLVSIGPLSNWLEQGVDWTP